MPHLHVHYIKGMVGEMSELTILETISPPGIPNSLGKVSTLVYPWIKVDEVTPKGRLLCSPVTTAAVSWLQNRQGRWRH